MIPTTMTGRRKKSKSKSTRGGYREHAGRPSLTPGKTIKRTFRFTPEASDAIDAEAARLSERLGRAVSASDAIDVLVRSGALVHGASAVSIHVRKEGKGS